MGLIGIREAAQLLGIDCDTLYRLVSTRQIPFVRYNQKASNGKIYFNEQRLAEWQEERTFEPVAE